jgi:hypothetical protein
MMVGFGRVVTQKRKRATSIYGLWPLSWSGWPDSNRRPLDPQQCQGTWQSLEILRLSWPRHW